MCMYACAATVQANRRSRDTRELTGANSVVFKIRVNGSLYAMKGILCAGQSDERHATEAKLLRNASE